MPLARHAVRSGKDVYVEKPLGTAVNWARLLRDEVTKRKAVFQFGTWQHSQRHFHKACEMVANGVIGTVSVSGPAVPAPALAQAGLFLGPRQPRRDAADHFGD